MSYLVAIVFDNPEEAGKVRQSLKSGQKLDMIHLDDSAVVVRDQDGKLHIKNEVDKGVKVGTLWGSVIGALVSGLFFPIFGIALGALSGAAIGKMVGDHIDKKFVEEVSEALEPNTSAIFYIFRGTDIAAAAAVLRPYKGKILHTSLPEEAEESLQNELKKRIN